MRNPSCATSTTTTWLHQRNYGYVESVTCPSLQRTQLRNTIGVMDPLRHRLPPMHRRLKQFSPKLGDKVVPCLKWGEHYKYLGCKVGADPKAELGVQGSRYITDCQLICGSGLADWQKLDVLHRFAKPAITFILQNTLPNKTWAQKVDKEVKEAVKTAFKLPQRMASASLYAPPHSGGMGIPCIEDEIDIARVITAFKVLGADGDPAVRMVAWGLLEEVARRTGGPIEMENFLNSPPPPPPPPPGTR